MRGRSSMLTDILQSVDYLGKKLSIFTFSASVVNAPKKEDILTAITSSVDAIKSDVPSNEHFFKSHTTCVLKRR